MRRWALEIYADHTDRTRREESLRPVSGFAVPSPRYRASAAQHRHCAGGSVRVNTLTALPFNQSIMLMRIRSK
jgi:hypothetical protein